MTFEDNWIWAFWNKVLSLIVKLPKFVCLYLCDGEFVSVKVYVLALYVCVHVCVCVFVCAFVRLCTPV